MSPISTYRLQIRPSFDLDAAAAVTGYLRDLGVGWAYLSPILTASEGSDHGYDVVDPSQVDPARGGAAGLDRFAAAAREAGLGILVDIVPNHMGVGDPRQNPWWWDVLAHGRDSRYAEAFDIDWDFGGGRVRLPILGGDIDDVIGDLSVAVVRQAHQPVEASSSSADPSTSSGTGASPGVLRYFDHVLPLAPGSLDGIDRDDVRAVLDRQHWELIFWRREAAELNYRRFFAVSTLAGVRVEVPWVFDESHAEILRWVREGLVDGLRIDHPDGLLDPGGYLERLADALRQAQGPALRQAQGPQAQAPYVLVEKILEHAATEHPEPLPAWWETDGTTGYDAMAEIDRVLIDPAGEPGLDAVDARLRNASEVPVQRYSEVIHTTKRMIADTIQSAEVLRLVRCLPEPVRDGREPQLQDALAELLAWFPVYRSYLPVGRSWLDEAAADASGRRPDLADAIADLVPLLVDPSLEIARRFQQTTGPVMAKGVEDTAFYRYTRLGSLTEVGGDPSVFALPVDGFHAAQMRRQSAWPGAMTALSTHDTKRGEDVRARLNVLSEMPERWSDALERFCGIASSGYGPFDNLLWQAIVGSWPADADRLHGYAEKAAREAAEKTGWWDPDAAFEDRIHAVVDAALGSTEVGAFVGEIAPFGWSNSLSAKLMQLTGPGVPDVYQGSELWELSLVDPDNRRFSDFAGNARLLADLDAATARGELPPIDASGVAKLLVTSRALRLRRDRPELFRRYTPMTAAGAAADHAIAFDRGGALTVATRLPVGLAASGGWGDTVLLRHPGPTVDVLTGRRYEGSEVALADLLATYPVALLTTPPPGR